MRTYTYILKPQIIKQGIHLNHTVLDPCHYIPLTGVKHRKYTQMYTHRRCTENYYSRNTCQVTSTRPNWSCTALLSDIWFVKKTKVNQQWGERGRIRRKALDAREKTHTGYWVVLKELTTIKTVLAQLSPGGRLVGNCLLFQQIWAVCRYLNTKWFQFAVWRGGGEKYHEGGQHTQWKLERVIWWKSLNVPLPAR